MKIIKMNMNKQTKIIKKRLLITDLDNTIYDWVGFFVPSFYAMVESAASILDCDQSVLLDDLRRVHQRYHDSEHPFALLETAIVKERARGKPISEVKSLLDPAFHAFNKERKTRLKLYEGVRETLQYLGSRDIRVVAYTESKFLGVVDRLRRLNIHQYFDRIYCRSRTPSDHPEGKSDKDWLEEFPIEKMVERDVRCVKPNPDVLMEICQREGFRANEVIYVGDSLSKDVFMANQAGVTSVWAKYGEVTDSSMYEKLVRVSHWTSEDIAREKHFRDLASGAHADFTAETGFEQVIEILNLS